MNEFEKQIWASAYAAEYVRFRAVSEHLYNEHPSSYMKPSEVGIEYAAAKVAMEAVKKFRLLQNCEDGPYYLLNKE